jgi:tRNA A37 threonylcarbamoyladenosine biosynthesis protein TsaE
MSEYSEDALKRIRQQEDELKARKRQRKQGGLVPVSAEAPILPWFLQGLEVKTQESREPEFTWSFLTSFANRVQLQTSPKLVQRSSYSKSLDDLYDLVAQWKTKREPIFLFGELGCGKTTMLTALAHTLGMDAEFLQEIFLESPHLERFPTKSLGKPKLWIVEHYDLLSAQWIQALKKHGFSTLLKTGPVIVTSWPTSKPKPKLSIELGEWTFDSKLRLLKHIKPDLSLDALKFLLSESIYVPTALEASKVWGSRHFERETSEELAAPSVNLRLLIEESFTDRWDERRKAALESCDLDLTLSLVQEMTVGASVQGRCSIEPLTKHLDTLSALDVSSRCTSEACSEIMSLRLIQCQVLKESKISLAKFSSGFLIPLPQALLIKSKARTKAHVAAKNEWDTRKFSEDTQLFIQASGEKYLSPYPKQK